MTRIWWNFNWAEFQWINFSFEVPSYSGHTVRVVFSQQWCSLKSSIHFCLPSHMMYALFIHSQRLSHSLEGVAFWRVGLAWIWVIIKTTNPRVLKTFIFYILVSCYKWWPTVQTSSFITRNSHFILLHVILKNELEWSLK